jgi:hypothetical protein
VAAWKILRLSSFVVALGIVIISTSGNLNFNYNKKSSDGIGVFVINGDVYIKELGNQCLISHNEKYKPFRIGKSDSVYCCGRVISVVDV